MMRSVFQRTQKSTSATNTGGSSNGYSVVQLVKTPATMLAFLIAIIMSVLVIKSSQSLQSQSAEFVPQTTVDSQVSASEENNVSSETSDASASGSFQGQSNIGASGNTVTTRTVIDNGQASVQMEVNGEEVPVDQNGATNHTVTQNGGQTNINVNVQNGQSGATSSTFNSNSSNSSLNSSSFQSQSVWVSH